MLRFGKRKVFLDKMKTFLIYLIFLLTMLGTSTASGNVSEEGKNCVIFTSALFALFPRWRKHVAKLQGTRKNLYFPRLTLPLSYQTTASIFHSKVG